MKFVRRLRRYWPIKLGITLALLVYAAWPGRSTFTVSPETTYVTEPLDAEGYVDYPTALNTRLKKDITTEQNAVVLIVQAIGPKPEGSPLPADFYRWLEIAEPAVEGEYFVPPDKSFATQLKPTVQPEQLFLSVAIDRKKAWEENQSMTRRWPWRREEYPAVAAWIDANEKPLALMIEASKRPLYFHPMVSKSNEPHTQRILGSLLPFAQKNRAMVHALVTRAMLRTGHGDIDGAWQDLMACHRLGRLVMRSSTAIESLIGIALGTIAGNAQLVLLTHSKPSAEKIAAWQADLRALPPLPAFADKLDLGERFFCLDGMQGIACHISLYLDNPDGPGGKPPERADLWDRLFTRSIDWDQAFRNTNQIYDRYVIAARLESRTERKDEYRRIMDDFVQTHKTTGRSTIFDKLFGSSSDRGERIGNNLIELLMPALERVNNAFDRAEQTQHNLQIAFALAAYRAEFKNYPDRLDVLAPKYSPAIPDDLFTDKPLKYVRDGDGYVLYSVGVNDTDDEGRGPREEDDGGDDLTVRMPVKPPTRK